MVGTGGLATGNALTGEAAKPAALYERDYVAWLEDQAAAIRDHRLADLDMANLLEELLALGRAERSALESQLVRLLAHLLKYAFQPEQRSGIWRATIINARQEIARLLRQSPSLNRHPEILFHGADCYADALAWAVGETGLPWATFPAACPWSLAEACDPRFWPGPGPHPEPRPAA